MSKKILMSLPKVLAIASTFSILPFTSVLAADEHPDFSGVWDVYRAPGEGFAGFGGAPEVLPFTAEGQRLSDEYQQLMGPDRDNPGAFCVTYGLPTMMENIGGYPVEIIQRPEQVTIIYEVEGETRRIYFEDRALPVDERFPNRQGYSVGHWEGDTLVVETDSLSDGQDQQAHPHSDQATMLERFDLSTDAAGAKIISYQMSLTDPVYYTEAVEVTRKWTTLENGQILPYNCPEESWLKLLELRREQLHAGEAITATMKDVFE